MRLLQLSEYTQGHLITNKISQGHAKILVGLDDTKQKVVIDSIVGQKLSVRDTENMVKNHKLSTNSRSFKAIEKKLLEKYEKDFEENLPFTYKVRTKSIEIKFQNEEEIETFLRLIRKQK